MLAACAAEAVDVEDEQQLSSASVPCHEGAEDAGALPEVVIGDVTMAGPDCRRGSFIITYQDHASPQSGHRNFTVYPRPHQVASNAESRLSESTCNLIVPVRVPEGWQYTLTHVDLRADVDLKAARRLSSTSPTASWERLPFS